jgi:hypothetical protein
MLRNLVSVINHRVFNIISNTICLLLRLKLSLLWVISKIKNKENIIKECANYSSLWMYPHQEIGCIAILKNTKPLLIINYLIITK